MKNQLLVVDDDAGIQTMLRMALEYEDFEVITAEDGLEALEHLKHITPDLILLDLRMPNMDGSTFMEELEYRGLRSSIPVIVLTADSHAKSIVDKMHVDSCIIKPFRLAELLGQIRQLLMRSAKVEQ